MRTLPQDLAKLTADQTVSPSKAATDAQEALWTAVGFVLVVLMLGFLMLVTYVAPSPEQIQKTPAKNTTKNQKMEARI